MWSVVLISGSEIKVHLFDGNQSLHFDEIDAQKFAEKAVKEWGYPKDNVHVVWAEQE